MAEISQFTQPDASPAYFVDFLDFLDKQEPIRTLRAEAVKRIQIAGGQRIWMWAAALAERRSSVPARSGRCDPRDETRRQVGWSHVPHRYGL